MPFAKYAALKVLIGAAVAERRKAIAEQQCERVRKNVAAVAECMSNIEAEVGKAEAKSIPLNAAVRGRGLVSPDAVEAAADAVDTAVDAAQESAQADRYRKRARWCLLTSVGLHLYSLYWS